VYPRNLSNIGVRIAQAAKDRFTEGTLVSSLTEVEPSAAYDGK
jgi:hypothetical protein